MSQHSLMHLLQVRQPFSVRIMIPCYKEDIETLEETLECAIEAAKVSIDKGMANAGEPHSRSRLKVQQWLWQPDLLQKTKSRHFAGRLMGGCCVPVSLTASCCAMAAERHPACQHTLTVLHLIERSGLQCMCASVTIIQATTEMPSTHKLYNMQTSSRAALQQQTSCTQFAFMLSAAHVYLCDDSPKGHTETYNGQTFSTAALHQQMIDALYQDHGIPVIRVTRNKTPGGETNPKSSNLNNCLRQIYGDSIPPPAEVTTASFNLPVLATTSVCACSQVVWPPGGCLNILHEVVAAQRALAIGQATLSMGQLVYSLWLWAALNLVLSSSHQPALLAGCGSL